MRLITQQTNKVTMAVLSKAVFFVVVSSAVACSSTSVIKINSEPTGAKVMVRNMEAATSQEIGVTPLTVEGKTLEEKKIGDGLIIIELQKQGYHSKTVVLTEVIDVDAEISMNLSPLDRTALARDFDKASEKMFEIQRLIRSQTYDKALELTAELKKEYPELSTPDELEGSIFYLQKDFKKSLEAFNSAYSKNSENQFSLKMKRLLEKKTASAGGGT